MLYAFKAKLYSLSVSLQKDNSWS